MVWHVLRLINDTTQPWTTTVAMTVKDGHILGQDTIFFTTPSATSNLKITPAVSVDARKSEREKSRHRHVGKFYGYDYDLVTIKDELAITKTVTGEAEHLSHDLTITKLAEPLHRVNSCSHLYCEVKVEPSPEHTVRIEYDYKVYLQ